MKKLFLPILIVLFFALAACGGGTPTLEDVGDLAQEGLDAAQEGIDAAQDALDDAADDDSAPVEEDVVADDSDAAAYDGPIFVAEDVIGSYTINNADPSNDWHYGEITQDGDILKWTNRAGIEWSLTPDFENARLLTDDSFPYQAEFQNFALSHFEEDGKYSGFVSNGDFWKYEGQAIAQPPVDTNGPAGGEFVVDPTEPIEVASTDGTEVSVDAGGFVDDNGEPPVGDVTVNVFTDEVAEAGGGEEDSPAECEVLTVWSYDEVSGLWIEELAPIVGNSCVDSIGTVAVEATDEAGNDLDLGEGETAEVTIPCEPEPEEVLTVWTFDEATGIWTEEFAEVEVKTEEKTCTAEVSDASNVVFGTSDDSAEPTTTETTNEDGVVELALANNALLAGDLAALEGSGGTEYTVTTGDYFAYLTTAYYGGENRFGINNGDVIPLIIIRSSSISFQATIPAGAVAESGNAQAAAQALDTPSGATIDSEYRVATVGADNQGLMPGDFIEMLLSDANSSEPPYTVNVYRGEERQLIATFTVEKQSN